MSENKYVEELTEEEHSRVSSMECTHPTGCTVNGNLFTFKLLIKKGRKVEAQAHKTRTKIIKRNNKMLKFRK